MDGQVRQELPDFGYAEAVVRSRSGESLLSTPKSTLPTISLTRRKPTMPSDSAQLINRIEYIINNLDFEQKNDDEKRETREQIQLEHIEALSQLQEKTIDVLSEALLEGSHPQVREEAIKVLLRFVQLFDEGEIDPGGPQEGGRAYLRRWPRQPRRCYYIRGKGIRVCTDRTAGKLVNGAWVAMR
ncbi:hypothetical protein B9S53_15335 [Arthrospira sp. O9.13F]|nr:hypothetical protein B9S53_15335 [Arthrospira sp. O9.13F]